MAGFCEKGNERMDIMNSGEFLYQLNSFKLFKYFESCGFVGYFRRFNASDSRGPCPSNQNVTA